VRSERGDFTLPGVLVASVLFVTVLGATLSLYNGVQTSSAGRLQRADVQDRARNAADRLARELRNLASPTPEQPEAVDLAQPFDLVFKTVDANGPNGGLNAANVRRVRYCLNNSDANNGKLYMQIQTWTTLAAPVVPSTAACPGTGWESQQVVADAIVNRFNGQTRALFTYDAAVVADVAAVHADLFLDADPTRPPVETRLTTGVFLRNQNRRPTAAFTATTTAPGIVLNGSASADPEGEQLSYVWYDGATKVGTGIVLTYKVTAGTTHTMQLKVFDPAGLEGDAPTQQVIG
jgi:type II secretory pathway component PulJ